MYKYGGIYMTIELGKMIKVFRESKNLSRKEFCKIVNISTSGLAYYENGGRVPSGKVLHKIRKGFGLPESYFTSEVNKKDTEKGELTVNQQSMLIKLQAEKIARLEREKQPESIYDNTLDQIIFNFEIDVDWLPIPSIRVMYSDDADKYVPIMAKKLGYTEDEMTDLLMIGQKVKYNDHNIHKLRTPEQKTEMLNIIKKFMIAYKDLKENTTMLIAVVPVKYTAKNGRVFASDVEYRVNWMNGTGTATIRWANE
tara:strand:+ start:6581 stop:7342 length:762 start_codon:yes stop_codon:yes gene_type:complete